MTSCQQSIASQVELCASRRRSLSDFCLPIGFVRRRCYRSCPGISSLLFVLCSGHRRHRHTEPGPSKGLVDPHIGLARCSTTTLVLRWPEGATSGSKHNRNVILVGLATESFKSEATELVGLVLNVMRYVVHIQRLKHSQARLIEGSLRRHVPLSLWKIHKHVDQDVRRNRLRKVKSSCSSRIRHGLLNQNDQCRER